MRGGREGRKVKIRDNKKNQKCEVKKRGTKLIN